MAFDFERLLEESTKIHGHLCAGQVLGVKMSILGLKLVGLSDPKGKDRKDIIVYVEIDRCATDAIQSVTGCSLGHRSMKFMDYGIMAATFLNMKTRTAVRVIAREDSREKAKRLFPDIANPYEAQLTAYKQMSDEELFYTMPVTVNIPPEDMPGRPIKRVRCAICGDYVQDMRHVYKDGKDVCKACANGGYYTK
ncbi:MAG: FmdE family protein [Candidatus Magnetominusculus sp. LBB02]|nr:FmdE family protein [Candidatus Magnetominusculus sp. LBB02]